MPNTLVQTGYHNCSAHPLLRTGGSSSAKLGGPEGRQCLQAVMVRGVTYTYRICIGCILSLKEYMMAIHLVFF